MSCFKINIEISKNLFHDRDDREITYYIQGNKFFTDRVSFFNSNIIIEGERKKKIKTNDSLKTTNSTFYYAMIKSLLYAYFSKGNFYVKKIKMDVDGEIKELYEDANEIVQNFEKSTNLQINIDKLFLPDKKKSDLTMNCLMNLILMNKSNTSKFDYTWKCFNALIREIFNENNEFKMLKSLKEDLIRNPNCYPNILRFANTTKEEYLEQCFLNAMICNNIKKGERKELERTVEFFKDFSDYRVSSILLKKMQCKKTILNDNNKYTEVYDYLNECITNMIVNDNDIVRLVILKYAYYLRCKYFHAEKIPINFVLKNINYTELHRINEPLLLICIDLIENKI